MTTSRVVVLALALVLTAGCKNAPATALVPPGPPEETPVLAGAGFLALVPGEAVAAAAAASPEALFARIGWAEIAVEFKDKLAPVRDATLKALGHDLLDVTTWTKIGIDSAKPIGAAWIDVRDQVGAFYVGVSDPIAFEGTLRAAAVLARQEVTSRRVAGGLVLSTERADWLQVVVRDGWAAIVVADSDSVAIRTADRIAGLEEKHSLAANAGFKAAIADLDAGRDAAAWIDQKRTLETVLSIEAERQGRSSDSYFKEQLASLRDSGAPPEEIKQWEDQAKYMEAWKKREREWHGVARKLLGPVETVTLGLRIEGESVAGRLHVRVGEDALLRQLVRNGKGRPAVLRALPESPFWMLTGTVEPKALWSLIGEIAGIEDDKKDLDQLTGHVKSELGVDLEQDLLPLLTGEIGFAITGKLDEMANEDSRPTFGGGVVIAVSDEAKVRELLARAASRPQLSRIVTEATEVGGWKASVPDLGTVWASVGGGYIALGTTRDFVTGVKGGGTSYLAKLDNLDLQALLSTEDVAGAWSMGTGFIAMAFFQGKEYGHAPRSEEDGPPSDAVRKVQDEIDAAQREIDGLYDKQQLGEWVHFMAIASAIGTIALVVHETPDGFVATGGQYVGGGSIVSAVKVVATEGLALAALDKEFGKQRDQFWEKWSKLRDELRAIEQAERLKALEVPPLPPPVPAP